MAFAAMREKFSAALPWIEKSRPTVTGATAFATAHRVDAGPSVIPFPPVVGSGLRSAGCNPRWMSPRQVQELSRRLFFDGQLNEEDSLRLGAHAELHPGYAQTVGAITRRPPQPDTPRDLVAEWEQRLAFIRTQAPEDQPRIDQIGRILDVLCALSSATTGARRRPSAGAITP